jgi:hypothetical protein
MSIIANKTGRLSGVTAALVVRAVIVLVNFPSLGAGGFFEVTPAYSNAVARVLMPEFSDFARRMRLPIELPLTTNSILRFACADRVGDVGGVIWLTNRTFICFERGHINQYETTNSFFALQDPDEIPRFYGDVKLSRTDAIRIARETILRLGHSLESVFAELEPDIEGPTRSSTDKDKWVPNYQITWKYPDGGSANAKIEVNGESGEVTRVYFLSRNLVRPPPSVTVPQTPLPKGHPLVDEPLPINPEYIRRLRPLALEAANSFLRKTGLGKGEIATNQVAEYYHTLEPTGVDTLIALTNGVSFVFKLNRITRYQRPDVFFTANRPYVISDFKGQWKLTDQEAEDRARAIFKRLEEPAIALGVDVPPKHKYRPRTPGFDPPLIPRISLHWSQKDQNGRFLSNADIEVNTETGEITYVGWSHRKMLGDKPAIDVVVTPDAVEKGD